MGLRLPTATFQSHVARAIKGAGNNKMIPITGLMLVEAKDNRIHLMTTDGINYLSILQDKVLSDDFYAVVPIDRFSKLISKFSSDHIELEKSGDKLRVVGNGSYLIDMPLDEEGEPIKFPLYTFNEKAPKIGAKLSTLKLILNANKPSLAATMEMPCYTGYYFGEAVITSDLSKICYTATKLFDQPLLLPSEFVSLFGVLEEENLTIQIDGKKIRITAPDCVIYSRTMDDVIEEFNVEAIEGLVKTDFPSRCKLPRQEFLAVLDRLGLFVTQYDRNGVELLFTPEGLVIHSKQQTGSEVIKYVESQNFAAFTCLADIQMLRGQVASQTGEVMELWYGREECVKMTSGIVTQIVALMEEEEPGADEGATGELDGSAEQ